MLFRLASMLSVFSLIGLTSCGSGIFIANPLNALVNNETIFMGDSITRYWSLPQHNAGIAGQTTGQMLSRFSKDVLGHGYRRVVILGGTNDITERMEITDTLSNLSAMAASAQASGLQITMCTLPPLLNGDGWNSRGIALNKAISTLAQQKGYSLVDYYSPMVNHPEDFVDGVHPTHIGYATMETALADVINDK